MTRLFATISVLVLIGAFYCAPCTAQIGPCATIAGPLLPDLMPNQKVLAASILTTSYYAGPCEVAEGSFPAAGVYTLVKFATQTENIGQTAMVLGAPGDCPNIFEPSYCLGWHALDPHSYRLWTVAGWKAWLLKRDLRLPITGTINETLLKAAAADGGLVRTAVKYWFDFEDYYHTDKARGPATAVFSDTYQGLSVGWADIYGRWALGQEIIIDGLPKGRYVIEVHINPNQRLPESDYTNNSAAAQFNWTGKI